MGGLNWISLLGLFVMILLAWAVSSHRTRVNWRLVAIGVVLQAVLAAVLFQSQNWTFEQQFSSFSEFKLAVDSGKMPAASAEGFVKSKGFESFQIIVDDMAAGSYGETAIGAKFGGNTFAVPTYPNGILFTGVNSIFAAIIDYVGEGSSSFSEPTESRQAIQPTHWF